MSKNIFRVDTIEEKPNVSSGNLNIDSLSFNSGTTSQALLIVDNKNVEELLPGDENFILTSSGVTGDIQWRNNVNVSSVSTDNLTFKTGGQNQDILILDQNSTVQGLGLGTNNDILTSFEGSLSWRNSANLQDITVNNLKINGAQPGDLLSFTTDNQAILLPRPNQEGQLLTSINTPPYYNWQNFIFPNPLELINLISINITSTSNLNSYNLTNTNTTTLNQDIRIQNRLGRAGMYLIDGNVRYLESYHYTTANGLSGITYENNNPITISVPTSWDTLYDYELTVSFQCSVTCQTSNSPNNLSFFQLRNGFVSYGQLFIGQSSEQTSQIIRTIIPGSPNTNNFNLFVSRAATADVNLRVTVYNVLFTYKPIF